MTVLIPRTIPGSVPGPPAPRHRSRVVHYLQTTDPKDIGILYLVTTFGFFLAAGLMALVMRAELARPGLQILSTDQYDQLFTLHGTVMLLFAFTTFLIAVPTGIELSTGSARCGRAS